MRFDDKDTRDVEEDTILKVIVKIQISEVIHTSFEISWKENFKG